MPKPENIIKKISELKNTNHSNPSANSQTLLFKLKGIVAYAAFFFADAVFIFSAFLMYLFLFPFPEFRRKAVSAFLGKLLYFVLLKLLPAMGCYKIAGICGLENIKKSGCIYVANHTSLLDPMILLSIIPNAGALVKTRYKSWLSVRFLVEFFNFISVDETSADSILKAESKIIALLRAGGNVIIFPEGSRSPSGRLREFKKLAFKIAKSLNVDVVPVSIYSKFPFLTRGGKWFFPPQNNVFKTEFFEALPADSFKTASAISDSAFETISASLSENKRKNL